MINCNTQEPVKRSHVLATKTLRVRFRLNESGLKPFQSSLVAVSTNDVINIAADDARTAFRVI